MMDRGGLVVSDLVRDNNGVVSSATAIPWGQGRTGAVIAPNGTSYPTQGIYCARTSADFSGRNPWTVSAWCRSNNTANNIYEFIFSVEDIASLYVAINVNRYKEAAGAYAGGVLGCNRASAGIGSSSLYTGPNTFLASTWYSVCAMYDGANLRSYINGVFAVQTPSTFSVSNNSLGQSLLQENGFRFRLFRGSVSDIRVWNRALTANEIADMYSNPWALYDSSSPIVAAKYEDFPKTGGSRFKRAPPPKP